MEDCRNHSLCAIKLIYFIHHSISHILRYMYRILRWSIDDMCRGDIMTETTATPRWRFCCNRAHIYRPRRNNEIRLPWIELRVVSSDDKWMIHLHIGTMQVIALRWLDEKRKRRTIRNSYRNTRNLRFFQYWAVQLVYYFVIIYITFR